MTRTSLHQRLEANSIPEPNTGCTLWLGCLSSTGYGVIWYNKKNRYVHRVVFEYANGSLTFKDVVMHTCDTPVCINLLHLRKGTQLDNLLDMCTKDRQKRKLPANIDVWSESGVALARKYNVTSGTIYYRRRKENTK